MSQQHDPEAEADLDVEVTGAISGGKATVTAKVGEAMMTATWKMGDEGTGELDLLYNAFPAAMTEVILAINAQIEADS